MDTSTGKGKGCDASKGKGKNGKGKELCKGWTPGSFGDKPRWHWGARRQIWYERKWFSYIDHKNEEAWERESMCSSFSGSYTQSEVDAMEASEDSAEARRSRALSPQRDPFIFVLAIVVSWS